MKRRKLFYFIVQAVYQGNPNSPESAEEGHLYDEGVRMGSWGLLLHCLTSALYATVVERLTLNYGYRTTYLLGMTSFCFAMAGMTLIRNPVFVTLMAGLTGFAYATLTTVPFMLVTMYHTDKKVRYCCTKVLTLHRYLAGYVGSFGQASCKNKSSFKWTRERNNVGKWVI